MNWGKSIILVFIIFFLGVGFMVYKSVTKKIDLVTPDYYEKELVYQQEIDKINNANKLNQTVMINLSNNKLIISYPKPESGIITGKIVFYKPSDASKDFSMDINTDSDYKQIIETNRLDGGYWKVKINWNMNGKDYYFEDKIILN